MTSVSQAIQAEETSAEKKLLAKLLAIQGELNTLPKEGENESQKYKYVKAETVLREIRTKLAEKQLIILPGAIDCSHFSETGGKSFVTTVALNYTVHDLETGASVNFPWIGSGADIGGDKGLYKAYTGGLKYFLLQLFLVPTGDDPEADEKIDKQQTATRKAIPDIPLDRAKKILELAQEYELAEGTKLNPLLAAKLVDVGVESGKLGHLNVDQAEAVEAFIKEQVQ